MTSTNLWWSRTGRYWPSLLGSGSVVILLSCLQIFSFVYSQENDQKIKLTDLQTITLFKDRYTNSRRLASIPQLRCIGSFWKCQSYTPAVVECYNKGYDGLEVQWECKADLDKTVKFGMMKVVCEGYNFPEDPYILENSCGLEYTLEFTRSNRNYDYYNSNLYETSKLSNFLTLLIMVVIILAVYKTCNKNRELELRREINGTYAHVIDSSCPLGTAGVPTSSDVYPSSASPLSAYHGLAGITGGGVSQLFPPPPPPYGSVVAGAGSDIATAVQQQQQTTDTPAIQSVSGGAAATTLCPPQAESGQDVTLTVVGSSEPSTTSSSGNPSTVTSVAFKPDDTQESTPSPSHPQSTSHSSWSSFLAGRTAAVSGYLLNRRNTSPHRSDSPPPTYEETRTINASTSSSRRS